ncbi:MAG TPA: glutamine--fructose-6-phosphate transaminase (isomerizing) [Firmicutes bacterium]|jgi:glucosamine--fructose-6-phosphate aminotransferase (isomerizing)|nr:glutamine--fructose-6-phosphate transaminase (isomerizing) [Bacillota bacterium]HOQ23620.1 glutamine--fructose-6-phosphate transaminase (isomerizing) [Bacillota bacterium]HPT68064.1 glutamine--fructose-6-phosphate transaminase (isomerizing) [Bacillota bacterium]
MCGIMGYIGPKQAVPIIVDGLNKLEYRGYDSAGVAVVNDGKLSVTKTVGRLAKLAEVIAQKPLSGQVGIGHTRWATHGRPSDRNSHPHTDCNKRIAVVHNGIIENYLKLRNELQEKGHIFLSETDTEVIPHLIEEYYHGDLLAAVRQAVIRLEGSFAIVVTAADEPERLVVARKASPLIVGLGQGENYVASDIPAILNYTREVYILDDGELAEVTATGIFVSDFAGNPVRKSVFHVQWDAVAAEKGGYEDFMLKEIHEQPRAIRDTLAGKIDKENKRVVLPEVKMGRTELQKIKKIFITACGTAYHAGLVGKYIFEKLTRIPVEVDVASEFRYRNPIIDESMLTIVVSQSGETADTLAAMREAKARGTRVLAITNVVGSSVAREADDLILTLAGPEIAVASTKAYTTQLLSIYLLGIFIAQELGTITDAERAEMVDALLGLAEQVEKVLNTEAKIKEFAEDFKDKENIFFIGRGLDYYVSLEGALKLKEISYIHAEAYAAGELKHGTLALIVEGVPVFALATQPDLYEKMLSNIKEVKAREATVVALANTGDHELKHSVDYVLHIPKTLPIFTSILAVVPLQLFAYYAAKSRGCDVDKPRNLAKSVTVE